MKGPPGTQLYDTTSMKEAGLRLYNSITVRVIMNDIRKQRIGKDRMEPIKISDILYFALTF